MTIKISTALLAEALTKQVASATRAANNTKNPTIKQCHEQEARQGAAILAALPNILELYLTELEPKNK